MSNPVVVEEIQNVVEATPALPVAAASAAGERDTRTDFPEYVPAQQEGKVVSQAALRGHPPTAEEQLTLVKAGQQPPSNGRKIAKRVSGGLLSTFGFLADKLTVAGELILQRAQDIIPEKVTWVWPGVIPLGKLVVFAGDPGLGKSAVSLDVVAHVATGRNFPDGTQPLTGEAIILSAEDDPADTLRPRLEAAGADLSKVHIVEAVKKIYPSGQAEEKGFNLATDLPQVEATLEAHPDVRLIVVDPISAYMGTTDTHRTASMRGQVYAPLAKLAAKHKVAILAIDHLNKADKKAIYRVSGSIATVAAARAVWVFAKERADENRRLMLPLKMNLARDQQGFAYRIEDAMLPTKPEPIPTIRIAWESSRVKENINDVLSETADKDASQLAEAMEWLKGQLPEPKESAKLKIQADLDGLSWSTVKRAKEELGVKPFKHGDHWMWPAVKKTNSEQ